MCSKTQAADEVHFSIFYAPDGKTFLLATDPTKGYVAEESRELPPNPAEDFRIKRDRESQDFFITSATLGLSAWAPWMHYVVCVRAAGAVCHT